MSLRTIFALHRTKWKRRQGLFATATTPRQSRRGAIAIACPVKLPKSSTQHTCSASGTKLGNIEQVAQGRGWVQKTRPFSVYNKCCMKTKRILLTVILAASLIAFCMGAAIPQASTNFAYAEIKQPSGRTIIVPVKSWSLESCNMVIIHTVDGDTYATASFNVLLKNRP